MRRIILLIALGLLISQQAHALPSAIQAAVTRTPRGGVTPVARWAFDEGSGTSSADATGHGHTLTINDGTNWGLANSLTCENGDCYNYPTGNYAKTADTNCLTMSDDFTVSAWVYFTTTGVGHMVFICGGAWDSEVGWYLLIDDSQNLRCNFFQVGGGFTSATSSGSVPTSAWAQVGCRKNGTAVTTWINGSQDGSGTASTASILFTGGVNPKTVIGNNEAFTNQFEGILDEIRVYDVPLSDAAMACLHSTPTGAC